jgi:3-hydroxyisobutyrate dehydrogenase-like beta-hydroxyacid dehydrogenase
MDRTPHKAHDLVAKGAREAATPAAAAEETEATFTSLADDDAVRTVVTAHDGVAAGLGDGVLIDASTVSPDTTADLAEAVRGGLLASPILGSPTAVVSRGAAYLIGGPRELYDWLAPAYDVLAPAERQVYVGEDARVAITLKLLSNYLLMSGIATLAEAVATAQAVGLPDEFIRDYLGQLPLVAPALRNRLEDIISATMTAGSRRRSGRRTSGWPRTLPTRTACLCHSPTPSGGGSRKAAAQGWADADIGAVVELLRKHTSGSPTTIQPAGFDGDR